MQKLLRIFKLKEIAIAFLLAVVLSNLFNIINIGRTAYYAFTKEVDIPKTLAEIQDSWDFIFTRYEYNDSTGRTTVFGKSFIHKIDFFIVVKGSENDTLWDKSKLKKIESIYDSEFPFSKIQFIPQSREIYALFTDQLKLTAIYFICDNVLVNAGSLVEFYPTPYVYSLSVEEVANAIGKIIPSCRWKYL